MSWPNRSRPYSTARSVLILIGHLGATALVFGVLFTLSWSISWFFSYLDSVHKFAPDVLKIAGRVELGLIYVDIGICGFVLLAGIGRFLRDVIEG